MGIYIKGMGGYLPPQIVTNDMLSEVVETNHQWIVERTGIEERRISAGEDTSFMAIESAREALEKAGLKGEEIDLIIVGTISPDNYIPSVACMVQKEIGAKNATAFDISAACSGYVYGLEIAQGLMKNSNYNNALVIGAETLSKTINWEDRTTCVLFGDGAAASVLSKEEGRSGIINTYTKSTGDLWDALTLGALDVKNPYAKVEEEKYKFVKMKGQEVFKFATRSIIEGVKKVLEGTEITLEDVDYIVPHQANIRIIDYAAKKLGLDTEKFFVNISKFGNTSAASVPIALYEMFEKGLLKKGMKVVLVGFGGGLTFGATLLEI